MLKPEINNLYFFTQSYVVIVIGWYWLRTFNPNFYIKNAAVKYFKLNINFLCQTSIIIESKIILLVCYVILLFLNVLFW